MSLPADEQYAVLSYYAFVSLKDPHAEIEAHRAFLAASEAKGRIYLSESGINAQLSLPLQRLEEYQEWVVQRALYGQPLFKVQYWHEQAFPRLTVKYRRQLVAIDLPIDLRKRGHYLSPVEWKAKLEQSDDFLLLDVRNHYEWEVGHFAGAVSPHCNVFRQFDRFTDALQQEQPADKEILMCCTGGIRCEIYSACLREKGFQNVFQLEGGILHYGTQVGSAHWLGKLFVFDDRLTVPISQEATPVIGHCYRCSSKSESYYNCANMDCNELFLSCTSCLPLWKGCCSVDCSKAGRLRHYAQQNPHKPFRRQSELLRLAAT